MVIFTWLLGIFGALGVTGTIVAVVFFPAVAVPILQSIVTWILKCKPCLYALAVAVLMFSSWWLGHHQAVLDCRAGELAAELRNKQIDLDEAKKAAADESTRANTIEAQSNDQHAKDLAYISELKNRPDPSCAFDDGDLPDGVPAYKPWTRFKKPAASPR
jgi:hypothetical protein